MGLIAAQGGISTAVPRCKTLRVLQHASMLLHRSRKSEEPVSAQ